MHITIISVGRVRRGPELELVTDYASRFRKAGRALGFRSLDLIEVESGGGLVAEGERLIAHMPGDGPVWRLDEFGKQHTSTDFARHIGRLKDQGAGRLTFLIGGAEGYSDAVRAQAESTIALGLQTWPHKLVRAMLCEQLYRAASILAGTPYHKA